MDTFFREHSTLVLVFWVMLAIIRKPLVPLIEQFKDLVKTPFHLASRGMINVAQQGQVTAQAVRKGQEYIVKIVIEIFAEVRMGLIGIAEKSDRYCRKLILQIAPDRRYRALQVTWAVCELAFLLLFVYADMAQTANNLTTLLPNEPVPEFLRSLSIPLMASSVGTIFVLGIILGDFAGLTHVGGWGQLRGGLRRLTLIITCLTLLLALICSLMLAFNRGATLAETRSFPLDHDITQWIFWLADFSQSFLILSLLVTTILLVRVMNGLISIFLLFVSVFRIVCRLTAFMIRLIEKLLSAGEIMSSLALTFVSIFLQGSWTIIGGLFDFTGVMTSKIFSSMLAMVNVITFPLEWLGQGAAELAQRSTWFKPPITPSSTTQAEADRLSTSLSQPIPPIEIPQTSIGTKNGYATSIQQGQDGSQN